MRAPALVLTLLLGAAGTAAAAPPTRTGTPDGDGFSVGVYGKRRVDASAAHGGFSHVLYLNDCRPGGCVVVPGDDDSRTDRSSIPQQTSQLDPWPHGDAEWEELVRCVRETFAPFDIQVVTEDPGQASHFEVYIGGDPEDIQIEGALGVAPFVPCGGVIDNVPSFVFANLSDQTDVLCWAATQEPAHVFGLDHELLRDDPMTYLVPPYRKRFQNQLADCGEELGSPRECWCGGTQQNSYAYMLETFGASNLPAPGVTITTPHDGAWVRGGFPLGVAIDSLLEMQEVALAVDGTTTVSLTAPPFAFNAPAELPPGGHTLRVRAVDDRGLEGSDTVAVTVLTPCSAGCAVNTVCLGGLCQPGAASPGGLGASCTESTDCGSGACTATSDGSACTSPCDDGRSCPGGYTCIGDGSGLCWPSSDSGGCAAGGGPGPLAPALVLLAIWLAVAVRRRRARA